ncbi:hypothetical protein BGW39_005309 [Mortierella sp. 14UC]|nr:hypothetical protein BGW39_005309 [Mortierella sp. 14UC]
MATSFLRLLFGSNLFASQAIRGAAATTRVAFNTRHRVQAITSAAASPLRITAPVPIVPLIPRAPIRQAFASASNKEIIPCGGKDIVLCGGKECTFDYSAEKASLLRLRRWTTLGSASVALMLGGIFLIELVKGADVTFTVSPSPITTIQAKPAAVVEPNNQ